MSYRNSLATMRAIDQLNKELRSLNRWLCVCAVVWSAVLGASIWRLLA